MEPRGDRPDLPSQAWLRWLTDPMEDVEPQVHAVLLRELLAPPGSLLAAAMCGVLISVVGLILHFEPLFAALAVLQVAVSAMRAAVIGAIARRPPERRVPTASSVATSIAWCALQGATAFAFIQGGDPRLQVLSATMIMGMTGPTCAVNYPAPRLAILLVSLCCVPFVAGGILSGEPWLLPLALLMPAFLYGAWKMILSNRKLAVSALNAELDSARARAGTR